MSSPAHRPRVSVVMALRDTAPYVVEACRSVLDQTFRDLELVVVDDGSTDGGGSLAEGLRDSRVRVVRTERSGVAAARNRGLAEARGDFVTWQDADDRSLPQRVQRQLDLLLAGAGFVHHDLVRTDRAGRLVGYVSSSAVPSYYVPQATLRDVLPINAISVMARRADLLATPHDESLVLGAGADVTRRLAARLPGAHVAEPLYAVRTHGRSLSFAPAVHDRFEVLRRLLDQEPLEALVPTAFQADWEGSGTAVAEGFVALCAERQGFVLASAHLFDAAGRHPVAPGAALVLNAMVDLTVAASRRALTWLDRAPRNAFTWALRGDALALQGDVAGASESYQEALACDPTSYDAVAGLRAVSSITEIRQLEDPRRRLFGIAVR